MSEASARMTRLMGVPEAERLEAEPMVAEPRPQEGATSRVMQTFRMPRPLVLLLKAEAHRGQRDLTAHVVRWREASQHDFGLPEAATALLQADRRRLRMERYEYLLHVLYQRSLELRARGPGFDAPGEDGAAGDRPVSR